MSNRSAYACARAFLAAGASVLAAGASVLATVPDRRPVSDVDLRAAVIARTGSDPAAVERWVEAITLSRAVALSAYPFAVDVTRADEIERMGLDARRVARVTVFSRDETADARDVLVAFDVLGRYTNIVEYAAERSALLPALSPNPDFGRFVNADVGGLVTLGTAPPLAPADMPSDSCPYYTSGWNGPGADNQLYVTYLSDLEVLVTIPAPGVNAQMDVGNRYARQYAAMPGDPCASLWFRFSKRLVRDTDYEDSMFLDVAPGAKADVTLVPSPTF